MLVYVWVPFLLDTLSPPTIPHYLSTSLSCACRTERCTNDANDPLSANASGFSYFRNVLTDNQLYLLDRIVQYSARNRRRLKSYTVAALST